MCLDYLNVLISIGGRHYTLKYSIPLISFTRPGIAANNVKVDLKVNSVLGCYGIASYQRGWTRSNILELGFVRKGKPEITIGARKNGPPGVAGLPVSSSTSGSICRTLRMGHICRIAGKFKRGHDSADYS